MVEVPIDRDETCRDYLDLTGFADDAGRSCPPAADFDSALQGLQLDRPGAVSTAQVQRVPA